MKGISEMHVNCWSLICFTNIMMTHPERPSDGQWCERKITTVMFFRRHVRIFCQLMCFVFCLAAENTSTSFEFEETLRSKMNCPPEILRNDRPVPFCLSNIPKRTWKKTLLTDDFVYFSLEAFCLALLVRIGIHDRISPLFFFHNYTFAFAQSSLVCVCQVQDLPEKQKPQKEHPKLVRWFLEISGFPQSKHRSFWAATFSSLDKNLPPW